VAKENGPALKSSGSNPTQPNTRENVNVSNISSARTNLNVCPTALLPADLR
jgi:hypothetical protein